MKTIQNLKKLQESAFEAWKDCPARRRVEKARLGAELDAATRAVASAKKAVAEVKNAADPVVDQTAILAKVAENNLRTRIWSAVLKYNRAQEWPRCGQKWGEYAGEAEAEALIRANLNLAKSIVEERE